MLFTRKQQNVQKRPELALKDDTMLSALLGEKVGEMKVEEKKKRGRKPGPRKSAEVTSNEPKKPLLL